MPQIDKTASNDIAKQSDFDICVVGGAGHVGLPFALVFADAGCRVLIHDINHVALDSIMSGRMPMLEQGGQAFLDRVLESGRLSVSSQAADVSRAATIVITIGTPVDEFLNPVHKAMRQCIDALLPHFQQGQLIVLRSTVFPGTTAWLERYFVESGLELNLSFCPERVVQGLAIEELRSMPQIISASTPKALDAARCLFAPVTTELVELEPMEAEFAKLFNNTYRYIQFAISNQFYMIANSAGVDYYRILEAMTHNYPRAKDMPAAGFTAGPCLFKDTMQLAAYSRNQFGLGHAAMLVNEGLVLYLIDRIRNLYPLSDMTIGLLGMAFKADSDDTRASLSYKMKSDLAILAKKVVTTDPLVPNDTDLMPLEHVIDVSDLLILCVPHAAYSDLDCKGKPVIDVWNFLPAGMHQI